jgi:hypothetical protein
MNSKRVTNAEVAAQLAAIERSLGSVVSMPQRERRQLEKQLARVPDALIEQVLRIAEREGGAVANFRIDAAWARATLADAKLALAAAATARLIAQRLVDDAIAKRLPVAHEVFGIYRGLSRAVELPEGNALQGAYADMKDIVKKQRAPRRTPKSTKAR